MLAFGRKIAIAFTVAVVAAAATLAQDYAIDWHTVDGGGETWSTGGTYEVGGTIGQPDAGALTGTGPGGTYTLTGGFWVLPPCWCLSDMNNDGQRNADDIQAFVGCMLANGANCACADLQTDGVLDMNDLDDFVFGLLAGAGCP
jgi:hypothetical protein